MRLAAGAACDTGPLSCQSVARPQRFSGSRRSAASLLGTTPRRQPPSGPCRPFAAGWWFPQRRGHGVMTHRPTVYGTRHAISAGHYLAASAGFSILEAGGNAIDAGVAAGIALGVLQPDLVNFAGVAPILIRLADGTVESIAGLGWWPKALPADLFMREHGGKIPDGVLRTVVPAAPDAWITALRRHGTMRFADVAASAIRFAAEGFSVYPLLARSIASHEDEYRRWPSNTAVFLPNGRVPKAGEKFMQADLARTIQFMADQDRSAGPDREMGLAAAHHAFYRGDIAREIVRFQQQEGGYLSMQELAEYQSAIEPVVRRRWRGHELITCGAWCQGPALQEALALVEQVGIDGLAHNSPDYLHRIVACLNLAMADREYHFGDPRFVDVPIDHLLNPATIARRAAAGAGRCRVRSHAGSVGPAEPHVLRDGCRVAESRSRHLILLRRRPLGQRLQCDTFGWIGQRAGCPGPGHHAVRPWLAEPARSGPPGRRRAWQTTAADAEPGAAGDRGGRRYAIRHTGRRCADSGDAAGSAECHAFRHGPAERNRGTACRLLQFSLVVRAVRVFPRSAGGGGSDRSGNTCRVGVARSPDPRMAGLDVAGRIGRGNPDRPGDRAYRRGRGPRGGRRTRSRRNWR